MARISNIKGLIRREQMTAGEIGELVMSLFVHQVKHGSVSREDFRRVVGEVLETTKTCVD